VQFACEFSALLFVKHKFVANESAALSTGVNQFHLMSINIS
jgi:hypothetical protein